MDNSVQTQERAMMGITKLIEEKRDPEAEEFVSDRAARVVEYSVEWIAKYATSYTVEHHEIVFTADNIFVTVYEHGDHYNVAVTTISDERISDTKVFELGGDMYALEKSIIQGMRRLDNLQRKQEIDVCDRMIETILGPIPF